MNETLYNKAAKADFSKVLESKGYTYFTKGKYNLNIIGIRRSGSSVTNKFDDVIVVEYKDVYDIRTRKIYAATTKPGITTMTKPVSYKGCAILVPGQYRSAWKLGYHQGKYEAIVQYKTLPVYRDNNKDTIYDFDVKTIEEGTFGINIHKAGEYSTLVNNWSAGCQVLANKEDFDELMKLVHRQISQGYGKLFTYTLINEEDL
uniref:YkuD domain-containing protein n=1 Tax=Geladintestivirus 4 TaxID=3233136 RepID=A0AAU8MIZ9_9CAUD